MADKEKSLSDLAQEAIYTDPASLAVGKAVFDLLAFPFRAAKRAHERRTATPESDAFVSAANQTYPTSEESSEFQSLANKRK